jgi:hypothetical protein
MFSDLNDKTELAVGSYIAGIRWVESNIRLADSNGVPRNDLLRKNTKQLYKLIKQLDFTDTKIPDNINGHDDINEWVIDHIRLFDKYDYPRNYTLRKITRTLYDWVNKTDFTDWELPPR